MNIIEPEVQIRNFNSSEILKNLERAGRTCYKSEDKITEKSAENFIKTIINSGHYSVLEHETIQVKFICDRAITHELVRHRIGVAYSQESTRYCNYNLNKFNNEITVIKPFFFDECEKRIGSVGGFGTLVSNKYDLWYFACEHAESMYLKLIKFGATAQEARSVLPNSLKTEIVATINIREWRSVFMQRCLAKAHPQMRQIMIPLLLELKLRLPVLFDDINFDTKFDVNNYAKVVYYE